MDNNAKQIRVVIYIRVSTQEQAKEGYSIDAQRERLIAYCKARGWTIVEVIVDPGFSGANLERPGIQRLIANITDYDMVLVYKLDRLSRSQRDTLYLIESVFLPNGVDFVSMSESFDTSSAFGRASIGILSVFAQLEREQIKERTAMGRIGRAKEGKFTGGAVPIGYDYDQKTGKFVVNEYEAMQVRLVYQLYIGTPESPGMGYTKICEYMRKHGYKTKYGEWIHTASVSNMLKMPTYLGNYYFKDIEVPGAHEAIITQEMFDQAQQIRRTREDQYKGAVRSNSLLTGFIYCAKCGARCAAVKRGDKGIRMYVCYSRLSATETMIKDPNCNSRSWRVDDLDAVIDYEIRSLIFDKEYLGRLIRRNEMAPALVPDPRIIMAKKIENIEKQIDRMMDLYQSDVLPVEKLNERIRALYEEKTAIEEQMGDTNEDKGEKMPASETRAYLDTLGDIWDKATTAQKREILSVLVDRVVISDDSTVKIEWTFL